MTELDEILASTHDLYSQIEARSPISNEILQQINYQFRFECNYTSNRMEGSTLTRLETRGVMMDNIRVTDKSLKELREMAGHDSVLKEILEIGRGKLRISEKRIKEIHKTIIVETNPEYAAQVGIWKTLHNEIINMRGEKFHFLPPLDVPDAMHDLVNWLNKSIDKINRNDKTAGHPALIAFEFHNRFLTIHPFFDGNGRTARLLTNLILVANGYPPVYINDDEKNAYSRYLTDLQTFNTDPTPFYIFLVEKLNRSLLMVLDILEKKPMNG